MTTKPLSPHLVGVIKDTLDEMMADIKALSSTRCRYLNRDSVQCTGKAVDPVGEVLLCQRHLGLALELVTHHYNRRRTS